MSTGKRNSFYKTAAWTSCRASYLKSVGGLCERCLARGLITPAAIVHHKTHLTDDNLGNPSVSLSWSNLEALCRDCHAKAHGSMRRYRINPDGSVVTR